MACVPTRWGIYLLAFPHGVAWSGLLTATMATLGHVLPPLRRADGLSLYGLASPAGVIFGPLVGMAAFARWGFAPMTWSLAGVFVVLGLLALTLPADPVRQPGAPRSSCPAGPCSPPPWCCWPPPWATAP